MSLPPCFATSDDANSAHELIILDRVSYEGIRRALTLSQVAWVDLYNFNGSAGTFVMVPGHEGMPFVLAGVGDARDPLALSHLPVLLPLGNYRLSANSPVQIDPS